MGYLAYGISTFPPSWFLFLALDFMVYQNGLAFGNINFIVFCLRQGPSTRDIYCDACNEGTSEQSEMASLEHLGTAVRIAIQNIEIGAKDHYVYTKSLISLLA